MSTRTTIFFATDIHGSERCFMKFINAAKFHQANVLILGGDITGKALVPIVRNSGGSYAASFVGQTATLHTEKELEEFEKQVRHAGASPYRTTAEEMTELEGDRSLVDRLFTRLMVESVQRWCGIADQRLRGSGVRCYIDAGNEDEPEIVAVLIHVPPYGSGLDIAPLLDENLKPVIVGGDVATGPVGSKAVRAAIERYQPLVTLHGHIHESRAVNKLGRTTSINPGSEYGDGILRAALVNIKGKKLQSYQLVTG
jgi:Icc-related predicted phosphoesterase